MKAYKIKIYGRVQGVNMRHSLKKMAVLLGLHGYVQNQDDGSVLVFVQGMDLPLTNFLNYCKQGSDYAQVKEVVFDEVTPDPNFVGFEIR